jgi:hypothetical protein
MDSSCDHSVVLCIWHLVIVGRLQGRWVLRCCAFRLTFCVMCFGVFVIDLAKRCNSHFRDSEELSEVEAELVGKLHHYIMLFYGLHFKLLIGKFYPIYRMLPLRVIKVNLKINLRSVHQSYSFAECFSFIIIWLSICMMWKIETMNEKENRFHFFSYILENVNLLCIQCAFT